ncbi:CMGC/MAPK protein kinase [Saprolegnia diclina VS20]|uniref:Mitogen-activated protein kinase n=1 Tax=Saprolegnia diclina (strain VS20) TaxID=1156394 RepID=T0RVF6_SAPDV|nr:CMGC/MAPK protein kinase [Saprolegnia diclina VS20]EQC34427.1 CMGC/MAPK protein kinase [Saprolegnia diclina VS20]|eukprot:XP_008612289.1 CMGC/MAPK protein kinase [Saprolegnia diclina VS20]
MMEPASEPPATADRTSTTSAPGEDGMYVTRKRSAFSKWLHGKGISSSAKHPAPVFRSADVIQEGYMLKQGTRFRMWTKRYFILRLEEKHMTLGYYTSKEELILCSETPIGPGHALLDLTKEGRFRLELRSGTRSMVVEIELEADYVKWKNALQEAVRWHQTMVFDGANKVTSYGKKCIDDEAAEAEARLAAAKKQRETAAKKVEDAATANANKPKFLPSTRKGHQCFTVSNTKFEIPLRYTYAKTIGSGAYGVVIAAEADGAPPSDAEGASNLVAIKNIQRAFDDLTDAKRIVREIKLMRHLQHKSLLGINDILEPVSLDAFEDVYIVSECMATDLHRVIYSRHALSDEHICFFLYQMLAALKYVHSANVIHRDLKPSNILVNANCELKICDFGLARGVQEDLELTEYVVTRWYRAPEIMLGCIKYTHHVDVWSLGCIFAEMLSRKPLFPGQDYIDQLHLIMNALGVPTDDELYFVTNMRARKFMNTEYHTRGREPLKPLKALFADIAPDALDLLEKMLVLDPNKRIRVDDALAHPYFASIRQVEDETVAPSVFDFDFEKEDLNKRRLQELIWAEMRHFHPAPPGVDEPFLHKTNKDDEKAAM